MKNCFDDLPSDALDEEENAEQSNEVEGLPVFVGQRISEEPINGDGGQQEEVDGAAGHQQRYPTFDDDDN